MHPLTDTAYWKGYADAAQVLGGLATLVGVAIALAAAFLAIVQIWWGRRIAREAGALETHRTYLQMCVERPELGCSDMMLQHLKRKSFRGILGEPTALEAERALWFLSYVLHTMEQLLDTTRTMVGTDRAWAATVQSQLRYHGPLLREVWPAWRNHYGRRMQGFVDEVIDSED